LLESPDVTNPRNPPRSVTLDVQGVGLHTNISPRMLAREQVRQKPPLLVCTTRLGGFNTQGSPESMWLMLIFLLYYRRNSPSLSFRAFGMSSTNHFEALFECSRGTYGVYRIAASALRYAVVRIAGYRFALFSVSLFVFGDQTA
jgi:hypothetical protein